MKIRAAVCALLACVSPAGSQAQGESTPAPTVPGRALLASEVAGAQAGAGAESALFGMVDFVPQTILEYCKSAAPERRVELETEAAKFEARSHRAVEPYVGRLAVDGTTAPGPSATELDNMRQMMLASLSKNEPHAFCSAYLVKLRNADVDALAADAWSRYQAMTAAAKARSAQ